MGYDVRGTGLSDREVTDFSLEARLLDLEAVLDHLNLDRFNLLGAADAGPVAITYAARHPQRVSRLVLWCSLAKTSDIASPRIQAWQGTDRAGLGVDDGYVRTSCARMVAR